MGTLIEMIICFNDKTWEIKEYFYPNDLEYDNKTALEVGKKLVNYEYREDNTISYIGLYSFSEYNLKE